MSALTDAREALATRLTALSINVRPSPSSGHISPPAAIIVPDAAWLVPKAQMGPEIHGTIALRIVLLAGKIAAASSLSDLEALLELVLLDVAGDQWLISAVDGPGSITIAGTDYLSASVTLTRAITILAAP